MIKNVTVVFVVLATISLVFFSFVGKDTPTEGLTIGDRAPEFKICSERQLVDLKDLRGKYVLISFWASYDAPSRMQNASFSQAIRSLSPAQVEMVSVSFDEYSSIFNETIRKDRIATTACFVETQGVESDLYKRYRLQRGFGNYLIDDNGVIIAKNISADELSAYLN